jgi:hypothetical protein
VSGGVNLIAMLFPAGQRTKVRTDELAMLEALLEIESVVEEHPADPGKTVHLAGRVRAVLATKQVPAR